MSTNLYHKIIPPRVETDQKHPCLVLLHGRGADENDLLGLSHYLDERLFIISVRAPYTWDFGFGYTWFQMDGNLEPELESLLESHKLLSDFIDQIIKEYPIDESKLFLLGFSMGTVMGFLQMLTHPDKITGLIANNGFAIPNDWLIKQDTVIKYRLVEMNKNKIFIAHGEYDSVIPIDYSRKTKDFLANLNVDLTYKEYPTDHEISEECLHDFSKWLSDKLNLTSHIES
ncbi:MAG: hypothetical protein QME25_05025 [Bacteroidota bacterium]|nr:hypothetical protein [Bacteroidota bacterium]